MASKSGYGLAGLSPLLVAINTAILVVLFVLISNGERRTAPATHHGSSTSIQGGSECGEAMSALRQQLAALLKLRIDYGVLHCEEHGIGPTGGFCADVVGRNMSDLHKWDKEACTKFAQLFAGKRVMDLGCGPGLYGKCLDAANLNISWTGYDGSEGIEAATHGYVRFLDLSVPQYLETRFDWVMSLEVGEHIPVEFEATFIGNVARHATEGVVLTWAVPGQGGHHHVNERENSYIIERMEQHGFTYDQSTSQEIRDVATLRWFKNTILVFRR